MKRYIPLLLLTLAACSDWNDDGTESIPTEPAQEQEAAISFAASVAPSETATRADGSLVNRRETHLPETKERSYWGFNSEGVLTEKKRAYRVGIFGGHTGSQTWKAATDAGKATANFMYNQPMTIGPVASNVNPLNYYSSKTMTDSKNAGTYTPTDSLVRFWPNKTGAGYGKVTFWAYYPYNPTVTTGAPGEYGIHINTSATGVSSGGGMGKVQFTMTPDASEHSDFMISELVADCDREGYPIVSDGAGGFRPTPVQFRFHHMLAQVRLYAFIRGTDRVVYQKDGEGNDLLADATWFDYSWDVNGTITDVYGNVYTKKGDNEVEQTTTGKSSLTKDEFVALGLKVPDETNSVRWSRNGDVWDVTGTRRRAEIDYQMSFNNIYTSCVFTPTVTYDAVTGTYTTKQGYEDAGTLGSATVNHYIMNPYWFRFNKEGQRVMLNENYMYNYFEDTPAYQTTAAMPDPGAEELQDGKNWTTSNPLGYAITGDTGKELLDRQGSGKHYNYAEGNIILAVPQQLLDDNAPNISITAKGYQVDENGDYKLDGSGNKIELTARVTVNLLQMNIKWESGFIYCYAFIDELMPGDDKVRGPETITVVFDPSRKTDQW